MSTLVSTPQFDPDGGKEMPEELAALRFLAASHHKDILAAREVERCREAYMGRLDEGETVLPWKPSLVHPKVHELVERFTSVLTDSRPKFEPHPRNDEDEILAKALLAGTEFEWERQRMDLKMQVAARGVLTDGTVHLYTTLNGDGELDTRIASSFAWVPDPSATSEDDMAYGYFSFSMSTAEIERRWPDYAGKVFEKVGSATAPLRDNNIFNQIQPGFGRTSQFGTLQGSGLSAATAMEFSTPQGMRGNQGRKFRVEEWWFARGEDRELTVDLDDRTQQVVQMPGMARLRRLYVIEGHYCPELDSAVTGEPLFDHGQIPVSRIVAVNLLNEYQGLPYIQPLLDTAEQLADIDNQIMGNVRLMMHPIWVVPFESRIDFAKFFSAPGMVLPYRAPHKPEAHTPPALPAYVFQLRQIKEQEFDDAGGMNDISRGNYSGGLEDVSGKAVQLLQRPSFTRMKPIQLSMEYGLTRWGQQTMCNMMQFWHEERWRRVLPFDIQDMPLPWIEEQNERAAMEAQGMPTPPPSSVDKYLPEIRMEAGSNLPENQEAKNGLVFNLHDRGGFGPPGTEPAIRNLLKGTKYPDADHIAQEAAMATQQMQMQQMMMAQQAPPGKEAPPGTGDKATGAERSPAQDQAVMASPNGQEVGA